MRVVAVTGTPGVGKTTLCTHLKSRYGYEHMDLGKLVKNKHLYRIYEPERKTYVADVNSVRAEISRIIRSCGEQVLLIDGCYSHDVVPRRPWVGIFMMRLNPLLLYRRSMKIYGAKKARENALAEFLGVIASEVKGLRNVVEVDVSEMGIRRLEKIFQHSLREGFKGTETYRDWASDMNPKELRRFLRIVEK